MPEASAATRPGKVAVPAAWVKNASRESTIQAPSTPPATARRASSASAVRMNGSSTRSSGEGTAPITAVRLNENDSQRRQGRFGLVCGGVQLLFMARRRALLAGLGTSGLLVAFAL